MTEVDGREAKAIGNMDPYLNLGVVRLEWLVSSKFVRPG